MLFLKNFIKKLKFIKIDFSFILIFIISFYLEEIQLYFLFVLFMLLHEFTHLIVANKLGYLAKNIRLSFFGASLEGLDDFTISDEIKIVLAGPIFNFLICILCYLSFWFYPESYNYLYDILVVNTSMFMFNFLPIYPLDFGRIILVLFSKKNMRSQALKKTKIISLIFIFIVFAIFLVSIFFEYNFTLGFVCVNLMNLLLKSSKGTSFKRELFIFHKVKLLNKGLIERNIYLKKDVPLYSLFKFIDDYHFINFIFFNENFEIINTISEVEFYKKIGFM